MDDGLHTPPATTANNGNGGIDDALPPAPQALTVIFKDSHSYEVMFKLKPTTKLGKAMDAYSARTERRREELRFLYDGVRVLGETTPADLELEDGDAIEVHNEQIGGGGD